MKYINSRTVEYTHAEIVIRDRFEGLLLDEGWGITEAARTALREAIMRGERLDPTFVGYLSDDTLRLDVTDE